MALLERRRRDRSPSWVPVCRRINGDSGPRRNRSGSLARKGHPPPKRVIWGSNPHPSVVRRSREARYPTVENLPQVDAGRRLGMVQLQVEGTSKDREAIAHGGDEDDFGGGGDGTARRDGRTQPPQARTSSDRAHAKHLEVERSRNRGNRRRSGGPHTTREPHPAPSERGRILRRHDSV